LKNEVDAKAVEAQRNWKEVRGAQVISKIHMEVKVENDVAKEMAERLRRIEAARKAKADEIRFKNEVDEKVKKEQHDKAAAALCQREVQAKTEADRVRMEAKKRADEEAAVAENERKRKEKEKTERDRIEAEATEAKRAHEAAQIAEAKRIAIERGKKIAADKAEKEIEARLVLEAIGISHIITPVSLLSLACRCMISMYMYRT
jgi:colicin import membrane protein